MCTLETQSRQKQYSVYIQYTAVFIYTKQYLTDECEQPEDEAVDAGHNERDDGAAK